MGSVERGTHAADRVADVLRVVLALCGIAVVTGIAAVVGFVVGVFLDLGEASDAAERQRAETEAALEALPGVVESEARTTSLGKGWDHDARATLAPDLGDAERGELSAGLGEVPFGGSVDLTIEDHRSELTGRVAPTPEVVDWWYALAMELEQGEGTGWVRCVADWEELTCQVDYSTEEDVATAVSGVGTGQLEQWAAARSDSGVEPEIAIVIGLGSDRVRLRSLEELRAFCC